MAVILAGLVAALVVAAPATAHKRTYSASTTIGLNKVSGNDSVSGQVSSKGACLAGRAVVIYEDVSPTASGDVTVLGRTLTTSTGAWSLTVQGGIKKDRTYFARVSKRKLVDNRKHKHICKGATSPNAVGT